jgi:hypothetical protein
MARRQLTVLDATASIVAVHTFGAWPKEQETTGKHDEGRITDGVDGIGVGAEDVGRQSRQPGSNLGLVAGASGRTDGLQPLRDATTASPAKDPPTDAFYSR